MHPILMQLPLGVPVYAYGTMLVLAMAAGCTVAVVLGRRERLAPDFLILCLAWTLWSALAGARALALLIDPGQVTEPSDVLRLSRGGLVAYGGLLGGFAGSAAVCRARRIAFLRWADCASPGLCAGLAVTRIGCLLAGCDFGQPWNGPWAVTFPAGSPAFEQQLLDGVLPATATASLPVHPSQAYESLLGLVLVFVALVLRRRRGFPGRAFLFVVIGYGVARSLLEALRGDADRGSIGPATTSQIVGAATAALALLVLRSLSRRARAPEVAGPVVPRTHGR